MEVLVIDNFLKRPDLEREKALSATYEDIVYEDTVYKGISMTLDPRNLRRIEDYLGVHFKNTLTFYRRNLADEDHSTFIHSDILIGAFSGLLYLNHNPPSGNGTAFWKHRTSGLERHEPREDRGEKFWEDIHRDGFHEDRWIMTELVEMKFNRLVLFCSARYHSRYPEKSFGTNTRDARLIKAFFGEV